MTDEQALRRIYSLTEDLENSLRYDQGMMLRKSRAQEVQFIESEPKAQAAAVQAPARLDMASMNLESLKACISDCRQCQPNGRLFGQGPVKPKVMFILDQPSQSDVKAKALFSGLEGAFFDKWIAAISLRREDVFLTSLLRCHHDPIAKYASPEVINCQAFLKTQIALVQPAFIFGLGELTAQVFFKRPDSLETLRGRIKPAFGVPVLCSYSMAQVLSDPAKKPLIWADLKTLRSNLEL